MIKYTAIVLVMMALTFTDGRLFRDCGENVGLGVRGKGDAVEPIRALTDAERELTASDAQYLGYYYDSHGVGDLDFYRTGGHFVAYHKLDELDSGHRRGSEVIVARIYELGGDNVLAAFGDPTTPWRYRITTGLLLLLAFTELGFLTLFARRSISRRFVVTVATIGFASAAVLILNGMSTEAIIPLVIGAMHAFGKMEPRSHTLPGTESTVESLPPANHPRPPTGALPNLGPFPGVEAPRVAIERPVTLERQRPPIVDDPSAPPPIMLR
jgi:hypothetical protein